MGLLRGGSVGNTCGNLLNRCLNLTTISIINLISVIEFGICVSKNRDLILRDNVLLFDA